MSEILNGKKEITPETAVAIGAALGTSAEVWLSLQAAQRLHQVRSTKLAMLRPVERKARLRSLVPVRELQKRKWLPVTDDLDQLESAVCSLLGIETIDAEPQLLIAARRSNADADLTPEQMAWVARIQQLGLDRVTVPFDVDRLAALAGELVHRLSGPQDLVHLHDWLAECGVALVIEFPLRGSKIDGVVSFSGDNPIIGLSTRWDRMDILVFTLLHEIAHLTRGHIGPGEVTVDEDLNPTGGSDQEVDANETAGKWIFDAPLDLPPGDLRPGTILDIARAHDIHPCFVVGRLQNMGRLDWSDYRRTIPKVRTFVKVG